LSPLHILKIPSWQSTGTALFVKCGNKTDLLPEPIYTVFSLLLLSLHLANVAVDDLFRRDRYHVVELFKSIDVISLNACRVKLIKVITAHVAVGLLDMQHMVDDDEKAMGQSNYSFVLSPALSEAMVLRGEVVVFGVTD
jgi:hypothetical protein